MKTRNWMMVSCGLLLAASTFGQEQEMRMGGKLEVKIKANSQTVFPEQIPEHQDAKFGLQLQKVLNLEAGELGNPEDSACWIFVTYDEENDYGLRELLKNEPRPAMVLAENNNVVELQQVGSSVAGEYGAPLRITSVTFTMDPPIRLRRTDRPQGDSKISRLYCEGNDLHQEDLLRHIRFFSSAKTLQLPQ